ncbi:bZIP transcription factor 39-like [Iris pallida]|uniref:BZIP transcription factor 39-like n=1 Tax=Iris pallida TaxID=29817 RepID=A0AAX6FQ44_IRIPA|nr:bZIP transcription factor 39-like [Iris pallida]
MATHFDNFPQFDLSDLHFPELEFPLDGLTSDLDLDIDLDDISIDDLFLPHPDSTPEPEPDPDPNPPSPGSDNPSSSSSAVTNHVAKRKLDEGDGVSPNPKFRRSHEAHSAASGLSAGGGIGGEDEKKKARLMRNRESAQLSRQRRKHYVGELEDKVRAMSSTIADLNGKISFYMAENARLHHQLTAGGGGVASNPAPPPVPPHPAMHFPWVPYAGYPVLRGGPQVPLVPIPRLKPQQPAPATKVRKTESKRSGEGKGRTKKVPSVNLLGFFFVFLVFGGALKFVFREGSGNTTSAGGKGRVLSVSGGKEGLNGTEETGFKHNSRESIPALLYVPRNGKRVEINGNLIIHSVLASERALAEAKSGENTKRSSGKEVTDLAIPGNVALALAAPKSERDMGRHLKTYRNALASDSQGAVKSTPADGPLQQWFREGLAELTGDNHKYGYGCSAAPLGPILSSGTCTEVFQFEVSPSSANPSGIVPATSVVNATDKLPPGKMKNRRILYPQLAGSTINDTHHFGKPSGNNTFRANSTVPSMVVSVMADPREAGDGDCDGVIRPKSLSRIFVVVLMDSVKYVTYSCMLPLKSSGPHLVN